MIDSKTLPFVDEHGTTISATFHHDQSIPEVKYHPGIDENEFNELKGYLFIEIDGIL
jgi:hypothetical protein